jgi:DNA-binding CsgD family transcriptional regulator
MAFALAFIPIPAFSLLVLLGCPIQALQAFSASLDIAVWAATMLLAFARSMRAMAIMAAFFVLTGILPAFPAIPSLAVIAARFLVLAAFSMRSLQAALNRRIAPPSSLAAELSDVTGRFGLSPREAEILGLLVAGKTNAEIAGCLFISLSTVKTHIAAIFRKMGARNRLEASAMCKKT